MGLKHEIARQPLRKNTSGQLLPPLPAIHRPAQPQSPAESSRGPKVSVVMSCHNAAPFLAETMDSILTQTLTDWELLITDDGSTDETQSLLMDYANMDSRIRIWFFDDQKGPYVRRNFAIEQAKAPFISIQDADDLMAFNKLQVLYEEIRRDEKLAIVGSHFRRFLDVFRGAEFGDRMQKKITHAELMEAFPQTWHLCWHGSAIIRKSLFDTIGLYDEQPYGSDTFWLSKAGLYGWLTGRVKFKNVPEYLTYKREHAASQTGQISPVDPRSRRHRLERYYLQKLHQIMTEARKDPSLDPAQKIRECTCSDFIPKFGREFKKWESAPLNKTMVQSVMNRGLAQFSSEAYVSALITLNYLDQMIPGASGSFKNLNFTRGLAWYACGDDARAAAHLRQEIQLTGNQFAQAFLQTHLAAAGKKGDAAQRRANIRKFVETASQQELAPSVAGAEQRDPARMSDDLHGKLAIAKQFLSQGHTQRAAGVYRDLLSDNMLTGHIALKEKLQKLVGLIESAAPSTSAAAESDWKKS